MILSLKKIVPQFLFLSLFPLSLHAFTLTLNTAGQAKNYSLSWEAVDPSTTDAKVTYYIYQEFGVDDITNASLGNTADGFSDKTTFKFDDNSSMGPGSRCFVVISSDSLGGPSFQSNVACHGFIHSLGDEQGISRTDGDGSQRGMDQKWTFEYALDADSYITAKIYPPGTQFTSDANGFIVSASSPVVKTLLENIPRSSEMADKSISMTETWDSRSSSGTIVPNGIYYLLIQATLDSGYFQPTPPAESARVATLETYLREGIIHSIPVNIIRIMNLSATGITLSNPIASINYELTGDALVRVVVAEPGSHFTVDGNGNIQPVDSNGVIDPTLIVSSKTYQRNAGPNTETWDGTSLSGQIKASGVYAVGLSATDAYGNQAIGSSNNNGPIFTTVPLERAPGSTSTGSTPDTTAPTLSSIVPSDGSTSNIQIATITIVLADNASDVDLANTAISILSPSGAIIPASSYSRNLDNDANEIEIVFNTPLQENGQYTVTVTPIDGAGNTPSPGYTTTFTIAIQLNAGSFENSLKIYPNPAKNVSDITFQYDVPVNSQTTFEIFTPLGQRVQTLSYTDTQGSTPQRGWNLTNSNGEKLGTGLYIVRVKATGAGSSIEFTKKLVIIR